MVFAAAKQVGYLQNKQIKVNHVPFGLVLRADGKKFKTREGDTEKLKDLIKESSSKMHFSSFFEIQFNKSFKNKQALSKLIEQE